MVIKINRSFIISVSVLVLAFLFLAPSSSSAKFMDWEIWELEKNEEAVWIGWDDIKGADGYYLWIYDVAQQEYLKGENIRFDNDSPLRSIVISGLRDSSRYRVLMVYYSIDESGEYNWGSWSQWLRFETNEKKDNTGSQFAYYYPEIDLSWEVVRGADGYIVEVDKEADNDDFYELIVITDGNINHTKVNSLSRRNNYYFRIKATSLSGADSDWSPAMAFTKDA